MQDKLVAAALKFVELYPERALPSKPKFRNTVIPRSFIVNDRGTLSQGMAFTEFPSEYHDLKLGMWWSNVHVVGHTTLTQGNYRRLLKVGAIRPSANHE